MSDGLATPPVVAFGKRASSVISNAALYQLVQEMAEAMDKQSEALAEIHAMCAKIIWNLGA